MTTDRFWWGVSVNGLLPTALKHRSQGLDAQQIVWRQRYLCLAKPDERTGQRRQRILSTVFHGLGDRIIRKLRVEYRIHHEILILHAECRQFRTGTCRLGQSGAIRTRHQHERRHVRIRESLHRIAVQRVLLLQPRERPQAGSAGSVRVDEAAPRCRQRQQPQRMTGRRGVEHDVVEIRRRVRVGQEARKLFERRDLHRAGTRQLLFHAGHDRLRQHVAVGSHDTVAILACGLLRIEVQSKQPGHLGDGGRLVSEHHTQNFVQVGCGIRTDQEHTLAPVRQRHRRGTGHRGLANAPLTGEEEVARSICSETRAEA